MKIYLKPLFFLFLCLQALYALGQAKKVVPDFFILKGNIKNFDKKSWDLSIQGFYNQEEMTITVDARGNFYQKVNTQHPLDVYLGITDDSVSYFAVPGDTLILNCDYKDFDHTITIKANHDYRQKETDVKLELYKKFGHSLMTVIRDLYTKPVVDSLAVNRVKDFFLAQVKIVAKQSETPYNRKILADLFFQYGNYIMQANRTAHHFNYLLNATIPDSLKTVLARVNFNEKTLDEQLFYNSANYRDFIYGKSERYESPFSSYTAIDQANQHRTNFVMENCYKGMILFNDIPSIRDWFLAKSLMNGYAYQPFNDAERAYVSFMPTVVTKLFRDTLLVYHAGMQKLKPGKPAPIFSLQDNKGKVVTLSDFKGKAVYIDFWGVGCGPCIDDINNYSDKMHKRYQDKNVVFINICVDSNDAEWKKALADLHPQGINLIATGWIKNPVCKTYHIDGIPHYVLIDTKGNIVNNNADRMGDLLGLTNVAIKKDKSGNTELDLAVAGK